MIKLHSVLLLFFGVVLSCKNDSSYPDQPLQPSAALKVSKARPAASSFIQTQEFKDYWYGGKAEITSYKLEQARYGEIRNGEAVLVFVTEDFLPHKQVKADRYGSKNIPILKLNFTKNFNTGIYPYSIMQSTFYPVSNSQHALKVSCSVQEWCGHVYTQLNNRDRFEIMSHSYFESEADENKSINKDLLENELWTQLRLDPKELPSGSINIIPALEFLKLKHIETKAYPAEITHKKGQFSVYYSTLERTLTITYQPLFPYQITSWEETYKDGYGNNAKTLTTKATVLKTLKSDYWNKNSNTDEKLRDFLLVN